MSRCKLLRHKSSMHLVAGTREHTALPHTSSFIWSAARFCACLEQQSPTSIHQTQHSRLPVISAYSNVNCYNSLHPETSKCIHDFVQHIHDPRKKSILASTPKTDKLAIEQGGKCAYRITRNPGLSDPIAFPLP